MAVTVVYKRAAEAEITDIVEYHEARRPGVGVAFLDELRRIEAHLQQNPALYHEVMPGIRRAPLRRFPYGVFYLIDNGQVVVLACFHLRRAPRSHMELKAR